MLTIDRRAPNIFHAVTLALSPWRLVIDLGLYPNPNPNPNPNPSPQPQP